jgi:hypothetical protein
MNFTWLARLPGMLEKELVSASTQTSKAGV